MANDRKRWIFMIWLLPALILLALLVWWQGERAVVWVASTLGESAHPLLFLSLFFLLPLIGFPITVFLVLVGVKFGSIWGVVILFVGMAAHLLVAFLLARSVLRRPIQRKLIELGYRLPEVPRHRMLWFSCIFMATPGLPYAVKNYALALCGVPLGYFFFSGILFQGVMGVPFVIAGDAVATEQILLLAGIFAAFIGLVILAQRLRKHFAGDPDTRAGG